ncbi:hypothetical protein YC2023_013051 [Brassica napus]
MVRFTLNQPDRSIAFVFAGRGGNVFFSARLEKMNEFFSSHQTHSFPGPLRLCQHIKDQPQINPSLRIQPQRNRIFYFCKANVKNTISEKVKKEVNGNQETYTVKVSTS